MRETTETTPEYFRGPAEAGLPRLANLPGVRSEEQMPHEVLEVERYDTDDLRLAAAGITVAIDRGPGAGPRWRLDLPDGDADERIRIPVAGGLKGEPVPLPSELDELVRGASRDRAVRPVGRIRTTRTLIRLRGDDDRDLVEVVHDHVTVATLGRSTKVQSWTEATLRPLVADAELMTALSGRLVDDGLRPASPAADAELDRLLRPAPARRRPSAGRKGTAGAVLMEYVAAQVDRIAAEDLRVRRGEPDAVHQLRVASRRLRSALQAYRPLLDRDRTDPLVEGLRSFGAALAPARDAEVLRERVSSGLSDLPPELVLGPVQAQTTRYFARTEAEARAAVLTELDGERFTALRAGLDALVNEPPLTARAARPARRELPALAVRSARRLERAVGTAVDGSVPVEERDVAVHSARKAGKRLRYATEVARPAVGKPAKRFTKQLKAFQSALGEHQDTVVAREALRELGAAAHAAGENGFSFGVLLGRDAARAERIERELPELWAAAWRRRTRRWLP